MNIDTNPSANKEALLNRMFPRKIVDNQLNTFTDEGTAITILKAEKILARKGLIPDINIWCAQTKNERKPIVRSEYTMARYPNIGLRRSEEHTSELQSRGH